jgi:hypothetical protein
MALCDEVEDLAPAVGEGRKDLGLCGGFGEVGEDAGGDGGAEGRRP